MPALPLYKEVKEQMIQAPASGEWGAGTRLPVERDLARRHGVGIATVRAAVSELEAAGILIRKQGKGTFVSEYANQSRLYRFFNLVKLDGTRQLPAREFVLLRRNRPMPEEIELLRLSRYAKNDVYRLRTCFLLESTHVGVSDSTVPAGLFPRLTKTRVDESGVSLYALFQANYNVSVVSVVADLHAVNAPSDVARLLELKTRSPVLRIVRCASTFEEAPVELKTSWIDTTDCRFHVDQGSTI